MSTDREILIGSKRRGGAESRQMKGMEIGNGNEVTCRPFHEGKLSVQNRLVKLGWEAVEFEMLQTMVETYEVWLDRVKDALQSINMPLEDWQSIWQFDFKAQYDAGTTADEAAMKANRYWWHEQNKSLQQDCQERPDCWLPRGHRAKCQPVS